MRRREDSLLKAALEIWLEKFGMFGEEKALSPLTAYYRYSGRHTVRFHNHSSCFCASFSFAFCSMSLCQ